MIVIDASVWVSALLPHDRWHAISQSFIDTLMTQEVIQVVPTLFVTEVATAVARQSVPNNGVRTRRLLRDITLFRFVTVDDMLADAAATLGAALLLRGADSIYATIAYQLGVPLISWDNEHVTRAAQRMTVYRPDTAPAL